MSQSRLRVALSAALIAVMLVLGLAARQPNADAAPIAGPDLYADAVQSATPLSVLNSAGALGAPDLNLATILSVLGAQLTLDMGAGEEGTGALVISARADVALGLTVELLDGAGAVIAAQTVQLAAGALVQDVTVPYAGATAYRYVRLRSSLAGAFLVDAVRAGACTTCPAATPFSTPTSSPTATSLIPTLPIDLTATAGTGGAIQTAVAAATQTSIAVQTQVAGTQQTAIAIATQTAIPVVQTAVAGATQTAAAIQTSVAGAQQTAIAVATQTAIPVVQTAVAGATQTAAAIATSIAAAQQTAIAIATQTAIPVVQTAVAGATQTAAAIQTQVAGAQQTAIAIATQTAIPVVQTAVAGATQTAGALPTSIAQTATAIGLPTLPVGTATNTATATATSTSTATATRTATSTIPPTVVTATAEPPSPTPTATATLTPYQEWLRRYGLSGPNADPGADFDRDCAPNALEYQRNTSPLVADPCLFAPIIKR